MSIFLAFTAGFTLRGALAAAADGKAWFALILGALAVLNVAMAVANEGGKR